MRGIYKRKNGHWTAAIQMGGKKVTLGTFETEEEAMKVRLQAEANPHQISTYTEKMEMAKSRYEETMKEISDPNNYIKFIKNQCFKCKSVFMNNWIHYKNYGNFCQKCSGIINFKLKYSFYKKKLCATTDMDTPKTCS